MANKEFSVKLTFTAVDKTTSALNKMTKKLKQMENILNKTNSTFAKSQNKVNQTLNKSTSTFSKATKQSQKFTNSQNKGTKTNKKFGKGVDDLHPRLARYVKGLGGVAVKLNAMTVGISLAITGLKKFGKFMMDAVKGAGEVEYALQEVANITGKTGQALEEMKQVAIDVGEATKFTTKDMLEAQKNLGQLGLISAESTTQQIKTLTETVGFYAVASNRTIQDSAADIGALTSAIGDPASELADKMVYLANTTQIGFKEFKNFAKFGTLAKTLKQDTNNLLAMTAAYRKVAPSTRKATTHIQSFGKALMAVHKNSAKLAEMQSVASAIGKTDIIYDAQGNMREMIDIIADLEKSYNAMGYTQEQISTSMGKMFNSTAANVYFGVLAEGVDEVREKSELIGTESVGMVKKNAEKMGNTFDGLVARIQGKLQNMRDQIGESVMPMAKDSLKQLLKEFDKIDIKQIGNLIQNMISPVFDTIAVMIEQMNKNIVPIVNDVLRRLRPVFDTVNEIIQMILPKIAEIISKITPIISVVAGIFKTIWDNISPLIDSLLTNLVPVIKTIVGLIEKIWQKLQPIAALVVETFTESITPIIEELAPVITELIDGLAMLLDPILEIAGTITKLITPALKVITGIIAKSIIIPIKAIGKVFGMFKKQVEATKKWAKGLLEKVAPAFNKVKEVAKSVTDAIGGFFKRLFGGIDKGLSYIFGKERWEGFKDTVVGVVNTIKDGIGGAFRWIGDRWDDVVEWVNDTPPDTEAQGKAIANILDGGFREGIVNGINFLKDGFNKAKNWMKQNGIIKVKLEPDITPIQNAIQKVNKEIAGIDKQIIGQAKKAGEATAKMYNEAIENIKKVEDIENQIQDRRQEIYNDWQDTVQNASEKVREAEEKLANYRMEWYQKQQEEIAKIRGEIAEETDKIEDDMLKPGSILASEFEEKFEGLSMKHFKDQLFDDFKDVENQIGDSLDFLSKIYPKDVAKLYTQLENQVAKEQNKLFKNYLTDEEMYIFGDIDSRKEAIKQKYPDMYKEFEEEFKNITQDAKLGYLEAKVGDVSVVDDSGIKDLNKELEEQLSLNIEQDETYQDLQKDVKKYQQELNKVNSSSYLKELERQDSTLKSLEGQYKDVTSQLAFLNAEFGDVVNVEGYVNALDKFVQKELDSSNLVGNKEAIDKFMEAFDKGKNKNAANSIKYFETFNETMNGINTAISNMSDNKTNLEDAKASYLNLVDLIKKGDIESAATAIFDDTTGYLRQFKSVVDEMLVNTELLAEEMENLDTSKLTTDLQKALTGSDGNILDAMWKKLQEKVSGGLLDASSATDIYSKYAKQINEALKDGLEPGELNSIWQEAGKQMSKEIEKSKLKAKAEIEITYAGETGPDQGPTLTFNLPTGATGGLIGELAKPSDNPLNSYDNTPIWTNPNEYLLKESAVDKIGVDTLNKINQTGELPNIIDYSEFFKARLNREIQNKEEKARKSISNTENTTNNNTKNEYKTTIKVEDKSRKVNDVQLKKALTRILRKVS